MGDGKQRGRNDRARVFELAGQGLSIRQIADRMGMSAQAVRWTLEKGLLRCARCGRAIDRGEVCAICSLPAAAPLGDRLKAFRTVAARSQMALALALHVDVARVRNWEKGRTQPTDRELKLLADALETTVHELTGGGKASPGG